VGREVSASVTVGESYACLRVVGGAGGLALRCMGWKSLLAASLLRHLFTSLPYAVPVTSRY
jgi:hypothetical protein